MVILRHWRRDHGFTASDDRCPARRNIFDDNIIFHPLLAAIECSVSPCTSLHGIRDASMSSWRSIPPARKNILESLLSHPAASNKILSTPEKIVLQLLPTTTASPPDRQSTSNHMTASGTTAATKSMNRPSEQWLSRSRKTWRQATQPAFEGRIHHTVLAKQSFLLYNHRFQRRNSMTIVDSFLARDSSQWLQHVPVIPGVAAGRS